MTIAPPDLVPQSTVEIKDSKFWKPSSLKPGTTDTFRLMGTYSSGHCITGFQWPMEVKGEDGNLRFGGWGVSKTDPGAKAENLSRKTDWSKPDRPKLDGEYEKPKNFLAWVALSIERKQLEVLMIEQRGLREKLAEILAQGDDFTFTEDGVANFTLRFSRKGEKVDTRYDLMPLVKKAPESLCKKWQAESESIWLANFFIGADPFDGKQTEDKGLPAGGVDNNGSTVVAKASGDAPDEEGF